MKTTPVEWIRGWTAMLDRRRPDWRREYDAEAFEVAIEDLFGAVPETMFGATDLDLLGEFTLDFEEESARVCREAIRASAGFRQAMFDVEWLFRVSHGSSLASLTLREARAKALRRVIEALQRPVSRRLDGIGHALDMRDRRAARRAGPMPEAPQADAGSVAPFIEAMGREAAERVTRRARGELAPATLAAVRSYFVEAGSGPACALAGREGISPATLTRALQRLRAITAEELEGCPESVLSPFSRALFDQLGAA